MRQSERRSAPALGQVTLADVAALVQVSASAVSRTFTPGASVAKKTRAKVLEAAKQLGYRPNAIARTLSTRRSRMISVVVSYLHNQFYPAVIERLSQLLQSHGYHVLLFINSDSSSSDSDIDALLLDILQYQVDGIVLASTMMSSQLAGQCQAAGIPVVLFNRVSAVPEASTMTSDNIAGGRLAARILLDRGARRLGFISGMDDSSTSRDREIGFLEELAAQGLSLCARVSGEYDFDMARTAALQMFTMNEPPDGVFVANDHMAFAVLDALRMDLGLRVPQDVQVVSFDDVPQAAWGVSIDYDRAELGTDGTSGIRSCNENPKAAIRGIFPRALAGAGF